MSEELMTIEERLKNIEPNVDTSTILTETTGIEKLNLGQMTANAYTDCLLNRKLMHTLSKEMIDPSELTAVLGTIKVSLDYLKKVAEQKEPLRQTKEYQTLIDDNTFLINLLTKRAGLKGTPQSPYTLLFYDLEAFARDPNTDYEATYARMKLLKAGLANQTTFRVGVEIKKEDLIKQVKNLEVDFLTLNVSAAEEKQRQEQKITLDGITLLQEMQKIIMPHQRIAVIRPFYKDPNDPIKLAMDNIIAATAGYADLRQAGYTMVQQENHVDRTKRTNEQNKTVNKILRMIFEETKIPYRKSDYPTKF